MLSDCTLGFKGFQFTVKVCFAMIINKAQSLPLKEVGIDLRE
jgi:hypothetical protein